ncbi:MAG: hypothetical protein V4692_10670 [Bdellovibrionota bacterium]
MENNTGYQPPASRVNLERSLRILPLPFRRLLTKLYRTSFVLWFVTFGVMILKWILSPPEVLEFWMIALIAMSSLTVFSRWLVQWSAFRFDVCRDGISVDKGDNGNEIWFPYSAFTKVEFVHLQGWLAVCILTDNEGRRLRVPAFLQRSDYILDLLAAARPDLAKDPGFEVYRRTAISIDHGWARQANRIDHWPQWLWYVGARLAMALTLSYSVVWFYGSPLQWETAYFVTAYSMLALILWEGFGELWQTKKTMKRLAIDASAVRRRVSEEKAFERWFGFASWAIVCVTAVAIALTSALGVRPTVEQHDYASEKTVQPEQHK